MFIVNSYPTAPFLSPVVVISGKFLQIRLKNHLLDPPIKPDQLRLVFIDQFTGTGQPIIEELAIRSWRPIFTAPRFRAETGTGLSRPVEAVITRILHIRVIFPAAVEKPPMLGPMAGKAKNQVLPADSRR